jgi:dGTPase
MQTLEANVMDLADDIAYAIHDLEDFWRARVIDYRAVKQDVELFEDDVPKLISILGERDGSDGNPPDPERAEKLDILTNNPFIREAVMLLANDEFKLERWIGAVRGVGPFIDDLLRSAYDDAPSQLGALRSLMEREAVQMRENVVYRSVASPPDGAIPGFGYVAISLEHLKWHWMQVLKCISRNYVVRSAKVGLIGHSQAAAIRGLFGNLCAWFGERPGVRELPEPLRSYLLCAEIQGKVPVVNQVDVPHDVGSDEARALRAIADYICSLTDHECAARSRWLSGSEVPGLSRI